MSNLCVCVCVSKLCVNTLCGRRRREEKGEEEAGGMRESTTKNKNPTQRCGEELMLAEARFCDLRYKIYLQTSKKDIRAARIQVSASLSYFKVPPVARLKRLTKTRCISARPGNEARLQTVYQ